MPVGSWLWLVACGPGAGVPFREVEDTADTGDSGLQVPPGLTVTASRRACADPGARAADPYEDRAEPVPPASRAYVWGGGGAVGDLDDDGFPDVLVSTEQGLRVGWGTADGPEPFVPFAPGPDLTYAAGLALADIDGDEDLDLFVARYVGEPAPSSGPDALLRNDGGRVFTDITEAAGVGGCGVHHRTGEPGCFQSTMASFGDLDGDGDLDLFVGRYGWLIDEPGTTVADLEPADPDQLYRNEGDGTFTDISDQIPPEVHDGYVFAGGFLDLDGDGWQDLYLVHDFGNVSPNAVLRNRQGVLVWDRWSLDGLQRVMSGMSMGIADLNHDGAPDFAMPEWGTATLLESRAELGVWVDVAVPTGFRVPGAELQVGWGTLGGDLDNDGDVDLYNPYGWLELDNPGWINPTAQRDAVLLQEPDGDGYVFRDTAPAWGLDAPGAGRGVMLADLDRDGWLDPIVRQVDGDTLVHHARCGAEAWLEVELRQPGRANTRAVGARVAFVAGGRRELRWVVAGGTGYGIGEPPEVHVGLGALERVDVEITWPDGAIDVLRDVRTHQRLVVRRE
ncbi:MAG: CRTAC1 family protein [Myxococcales bacterium]|nr:CRTAC1 family protein [Myxococcales bacterium]